MAKSTRPRKPYWQKLSWHAARRQWKKFKDGKTYYLGRSGVNRSDRQAHDEALAEWEKLQADAEQRTERERLDRIREEHTEALPAIKAAWLDPNNTIQRKLAEVIIASHGVQNHPDFALPRTGHADGDAIGSAIDQYLEHFRAMVRVGERSNARYHPLKIHLDIFRDWTGAGESLQSLNGTMLARYHAHLLERLANEEISPAYAHDLLGSVRQFIRWCWRSELIDTLPRNLDALNIRIPARKVETLKVAEVCRIINAAEGRVRLYVSLALLCGMTAKDIADIRHHELNLKAGAITRQRSKTRHHGDDVPTVTYTLPKPVIELLKEHAPKGKGDDRVLLTESGLPLVHGNRCDAVRLAFDRLMKRVNTQKGGNGKPLPKIKASMKLLRATSANLLEQDRQFKPVVTLWLGHSPRTIKDRFYVQADQDLLDQAVVWLAQQYGLD